MSTPQRQLPLAVQLKDEATFDNFFVADNGLLLEQLSQQLPEGERYIYLYGSGDSGRSHLLQAACHQADKQGFAALYLPLKQLKDYPPEELFEGAEFSQLVCLDDLDCVIGQPDWELALFNLFNRLKDHRVALLVSASCSVRELKPDLADLASRLSWGGVYQLHNLNDQQLQQALQFRAGKRGLELSDELAQYIYLRSPRDMEALFAILNRLDEDSLVHQRKLTIPFVKIVLGW
jgi:DnaA family protein